jgi:hypothetical protein
MHEHARLSTADYLAVQTRLFWVVSSAYNGRIQMSTTTAIQNCNIVAEALGPHRRVRFKALNLQDAIIQGGRRKKPTNKAAILELKIPLRQPA